MQINPKAKQGYDIRFSDSPKLAGTFNYMLDDGTSSTHRRMFYVSFGDYYHGAGSNGLNHDYKISDDFKHDLFSDHWDKQDWNHFFNFLVQCVQFYLQNVETPFKAPMDNIKINSLKSLIGDDLREWLDDFFTDESNFNTKLYAKFVFDKYKTETKYSKGRSNFEKGLGYYCELKGYDFCPDELKDSRGNIRVTGHDENGKYYDGKAYYFGNKNISETLRIDTDELVF